MNINLTPAQQRKLIELVYLGEWMINAHHDTEYQDEEASGVMQQLLSAAAAPRVGKDEETGDHYLETEWVEEIYEKFIMDYDDHVFWDELTERLAQRDLARERGVNVETINRDEDLRELRPLEERYREELEERGVERLDISPGY